MEMREFIPPCGIAYTRSKAEAIITGLEDPINQHLVKLMAVLVDDRTRDHWIKELIGWFSKIEQIRLKPSIRPAEASFYFGILYDEPFGGTELMNVRGMLRRLGRHYDLHPGLDPQDLVDRLERFHRAFADRASRGTDVFDDAYEDRTRDMLARL